METSRKALKILAEETYGESYSTRRYCFDSDNTPGSFFDAERDFIFEDYGETVRHTKPVYLNNIVRKLETPVFSYFLDGSRRTYKVDDIKYNERVYPILLGQIGVACCQRLNPSKFKSVRTENRVVLALPITANSAGRGNEDSFLEELKIILNEKSSLNKISIKIDKIITYPEKRELDYSNLAIASLHEEMLDMEKEFVNWLVKEKMVLTPYNQLIKDGSIEYHRSRRGNYKDISRLISNYKCVIGVSKKFNPEKCVDSRGKSKASAIAQLPLFHRTPVFKFKAERSGGRGGAVFLAAWYIRIRDIKHTVGPFDGVIKVERILADDHSKTHGLSSEDVDYISSNLIWERNPTCYGKDVRWANHLYPIYLTELSLKNRRLSDSVVMNIL